MDTRFLLKWLPVVAFVLGGIIGVSRMAMAQAVDPLETRATILETRQQAMINELHEMHMDLKELLNRSGREHR